MTERLSPQHETAITTRVDAATPGPWGTYEFGGGGLLEIAADLKDTGHGYQARRGIARFDEEPLDNDPTHTEWTAEEDWEQVKADAEFTAHARTDVPTLLAELAAVRAERDAAESRLSAARDLADRARDHGNHSIDLWDLDDALGRASDVA
jgi:outer membrane murein-binding lipoprotein Lpp